MKNKIATNSSIEPKTPITHVTKFYTIKGREDFVDREGLSDEKDKNDNYVEKGYTCQWEEDKFTYARRAGRRMEIKLDDRAEPINPQGLYFQTPRTERWVNVTEPVFNSYINFLKTGNEIFYRTTLRNMR